MRTNLVILDLIRQPLPISKTKNISKMDINVLMICSSTETKKIVPKGMVSIIVAIIGVISFKLAFLMPTKVK